jgi:transcriptional regulator with XRE-family HTH domain
MQGGAHGSFSSGGKVITGMDDGDASWLRDVGLRIKLSRVAVRMSQEELARRSGLSRVTLSSIERGEHAAGVLTYRKLARALGGDVGELLGEAAGPGGRAP